MCSYTSLPLPNFDGQQLSITLSAEDILIHRLFSILFLSSWEIYVSDAKIISEQPPAESTSVTEGPPAKTVFIHIVIYLLNDGNAI